MWSALSNVPALVWFSMAAIDFGFAGMYWLRIDDAAPASRARQSPWSWRTPWWAFGNVALAAKGLTVAGGVSVVIGIYKLFGG